MAARVCDMNAAVTAAVEREQTSLPQHSQGAVVQWLSTGCPEKPSFDLNQDCFGLS